MLHSQMKELIRSCGLMLNPYMTDFNSLYNDPNTDTPTVETRFGCTMCPHKNAEYYIYLKEHFPLRYEYANFLRLVGSARSIIRDNREYFYYKGNDLSKKNAKLIEDRLGELPSGYLI